MKNTNNLEDNGSRWASLHGETATNKFNYWGATQIYIVPPQNRGGRSGDIYMILLEDGWHYATGDMSCAYCAADSYQQPTAEAAWASHELHIATLHRQSAEMNLVDATQKEKKAQELLLSILRNKTLPV